MLSDFGTTILLMSPSHAETKKNYFSFNEFQRKKKQKHLWANTPFIDWNFYFSFHSLCDLEIGEE